MSADDLFSTPTLTNVPDMSVSDLAFSLKRTLEESYARVRVRGELSGLKLASSGHLYGDIKDEQAVINIVCWKGSLSRLSIRPEDGLDVVITGKVTSYPKNSRYQLQIDSMELAGEGAILKMLEDRRKKLAALGLFDETRKKPLPFLPDIIGVVTSPTGAVIRDIIHRISERFPRHILIWPVAVQGPDAPAQIAAAIDGFNTMKKNRPDVLIVARGGGSLEDLMAFNEEVVVRAAADSQIPLISAVGHETDTSLIDYAADLRAPTPTGAAERTVPVRLEILDTVRQNGLRLQTALLRGLREHRNTLSAHTARLGTPGRLLDTKSQQLDMAASKLQHEFEKILLQKSQKMASLSPRHPQSLVEEKRRHLDLTSQSFLRAQETILKDRITRIAHTGQMLESLSFKKVLDRGYAVVRDAKGFVVADVDIAAKQEELILIFRQNGVLKVRKS